MGVQEAHAKLFAERRTVCKPVELCGKRVAIDIASFKLRAFRADAPSYFRPGAVAKLGYRAVLAALISTWTAACGGDDYVIVVLDGARFPLKAREHARRCVAGASREQILADAIQLDEDDKRGEADSKYKELAYPVPASVDAWLVAHCTANSVPLIVAPFEAVAAGRRNRTRCCDGISRPGRGSRTAIRQSAIARRTR